MNDESRVSAAAFTKYKYFSYLRIPTYVAKKVTFVPPVLSFVKLAEKKTPESLRLRSRSPKEQDPKMEYVSVGFVKTLTGEEALKDQHSMYSNGYHYTRCAIPIPYCYCRVSYHTYIFSYTYSCNKEKGTFFVLWLVVSCYFCLFSLCRGGIVVSFLAYLSVWRQCIRSSETTLP